MVKQFYNDFFPFLSSSNRTTSIDVTKLTRFEMSHFNPPTEPAADRYKPRRCRRSRNRSKPGVLPEWAPVVEFQSPLSRVSEEDISPKTTPKQAAPKYLEHVMEGLQKERQPTRRDSISPLPMPQAMLPNGTIHAQTPYQNATASAQAVLLRKTQRSADSQYTDGRIIKVTTYQRINNGWADNPRNVTHEAIRYSLMQQVTDYLHLMLDSVPEETFESHRRSYVLPRTNWGSPDSFGLKWHRLYLRETMTEGAKSFMSGEVADYLIDEEMWNEKCEVNLGDFNPPYMSLETELALFDWRRVMIMGARNDILKDAGIMARDGWLRLHGKNGQTGHSEPGPAIEV